MEEPITRLGETKEPQVAIRRRLFRWSAFAVVVVAILAIWFAVIAWRASDQAAKIDQLAAAGVRITERTDSSAPTWLRDLLGEDFFTSPQSVTFADTEIASGSMATLATFSTVTSVDLALTDVNDEQLSQLSRLPHLRELFLNQSKVSDAGCEVIASFEELEVLQLADTSIGDQGVLQLAACTQLKRLWLDRTEVTDAGLKGVGELASLEVLSLNETEITGSGLAHFGKLQELQTLRMAKCPLASEQMLHLENIAEISNSLDISHTPLTDSAVDSLGFLTYLKTLDIRGVAFSEERIDQLRRTLPTCRIRFKALATSP